MQHKNNTSSMPDKKKPNNLIITYHFDVRNNVKKISSHLENSALMQFILTQNTP